MLQLTDSQDRTLYRLQDLTTQRVLRLHDQTSVRLIQPTAAPNKAGLVDSTDYGDVVIVSIHADNSADWISIAQVPVDGAGGSAVA